MKFESYRPDERREPRAVAIRSAEVRDLDALAALRAAREGEPVETSRASFERKLAKPGVVLVAEHEGRVVAYGCAAFLDFPDAPDGWYLTGVVVDPEFRRRGIAHALTRARLEWIAERARCAYYFATAMNPVTIALHDAFGFQELTRDFSIPGVSFTGGVGILFRVAL